MDYDMRGINHREYEDMLAPAALGALSPEEHDALRVHLQGCDSCRETLARLVSAVDALALTVPERAPSPEMRSRLRARIERAPHDVKMLPHARSPEHDREHRIPLRPEPSAETPALMPQKRRASSLWIATVAAVLLLGFVAGVVVERMLLKGDDAIDGREIALQFPTGLEIDDAQLEYFEEQEIVRFAASDLPELAEGQVYQAWLIADEEAPPTPVGVIDVATGELATAADPDRFSVFAVTVEQGPLGSTSPTTDPVIVADLSAAATS
ncbi:MAG: anti-sigma factor [Chloroflexota bacterium]|nr:anti-sigma factor [Chloroflexota bacterium]